MRCRGKSEDKDKYREDELLHVMHRFCPFGWPPELASRPAHRTQVATTRPPASRITSPVIQADSSDARNTASGAISATRPSRPSGVFPARTAPAPPSKVPAATLPSVSV